MPRSDSDDYAEDWKVMDIGIRGRVRAAKLLDTNPHQLREFVGPWFIPRGEETVLRAATANTDNVFLGDTPFEQPVALAPSEGQEFKGERDVGLLWVSSPSGGPTTPQIVYLTS